jgi:hypothetical protein
MATKRGGWCTNSMSWSPSAEFMSAWSISTTLPTRRYGLLFKRTERLCLLGYVLRIKLCLWEGDCIEFAQNRFRRRNLLVRMLTCRLL